MLIILISIFGLVIGSFLNVCIYRVPRELSIINPPRSCCTKCKYQLTWYDNIPVISWLAIGGKCRKCKEKISSIYPLVEILSAFFALESYLVFGLNPTGFLIYAFCATLIVITFIDFEFKLIPDVISFPGVTIGLLISIVSQYYHTFNYPVTTSAWDSLLGMFAGGGFFYLISWAYYLATKEIGLGGGDIKLMGMIGAIFGLHAIAPTIFLGSLFGSVVGVGLIMIKGGSRKTEIPFGPWLSLGILVYLFTDIAIFRY